MKEVNEIMFQALEPAGEKLFRLNISHHPVFYDESDEGKELNLYCLSNHQKTITGEESFELVFLPSADEKNVNAKIVSRLLSSFQAFIVRLEKDSLQGIMKAKEIKEKFQVEDFKELSEFNYSSRLNNQEMIEELVFKPRLLANCIVLFEKESELSQILKEGRLNKWLESKGSEPLIFDNAKGENRVTKYNFQALLVLVDNSDAVIFFPDDFEGAMMAVLSKNRLKEKILSAVNKFKDDYQVKISSDGADLVYFLKEKEI